MFISNSTGSLLFLRTSPGPPASRSEFEWEQYLSIVSKVFTRFHHGQGSVSTCVFRTGLLSENMTTSVLHANPWNFAVNPPKTSGWWYTYPSEKWWSSSVGMMTFPTEWKNMESHKSHVPNHQPDMVWFKSSPLHLASSTGSWLFNRAALNPPALIHHAGNVKSLRDLCPVFLGKSDLWE